MKDIELERRQADSEQQYAAKLYYDVEKTVEKLEKDHRRSINKSKYDQFESISNNKVFFSF